MADPRNVSEADGVVQDSQGSQAHQPVQEQSLDQLDPEVRSLVEQRAKALAEQEAERIRREEQSRRDRMIHEERMRLLRQRTEEEQQRALEMMTDEDYGRVMRQRQKQQIEMQRQAQSIFETARSEALQAVEETVQDPAARQELETRINRGDFQTWKDFQRGLIEVATARNTQREIERMRGELEQAAINDATASVANRPRPDLRQGPPARPNRGERLSPEQNIAQGFAEAVAKKRRGR